MSACLLPPTPWTGREDPEDGAGARRLHHLAQTQGASGVIGFACDAGVARNKGRIGAAAGPQALRQAMANLTAPERAGPFKDWGDVVVTDDALEAGQALLADQVQRAVEEHDRVLVLGGGHETAYGDYLGLRAAHPQARIGILNLDAHLDLRALGAQGGSSGTPFTQIRQLDPDRFDYLCVGYAEESNTQAMLDRAAAWGVGLVSDRAMNTDPRAAHDQVTALVSRNDLIYLTIDIDVLPHYQAPGVSAPAALGVSFSTLEGLMDHVLETVEQQGKTLPLADLVELNPRFDRDGVTAKSAAVWARRLLLG